MKNVVNRSINLWFVVRTQCANSDEEYVLPFISIGIKEKGTRLKRLDKLGDIPKNILPEKAEVLNKEMWNSLLQKEEVVFCLEKLLWELAFEKLPIQLPSIIGLKETEELLAYQSIVFDNVKGDFIILNKELLRNRPIEFIREILWSLDEVRNEVVEEKEEI